jgi:hypothetical protein
MVSEEKYIPSARDAVMGYFGRDPSGHLRQQCVTCCDAAPLTDSSRIYGDLYVSDGPDLGPGTIDLMNSDGACDMCGVTFLSLSEQCQREHDEQQSRWARLPVTHVVEMGMVGAVRCRIY